VLYRSSSSKVFPPLDTFPRRHIGVTDASVQVRPSVRRAPPPASSPFNTILVIYLFIYLLVLFCFVAGLVAAVAVMVMVVVVVVVGGTVQEMLSELQLKSIDELVHKTVPANILREPLNFKETGTLYSTFSPRCCCCCCCFVFCFSICSASRSRSGGGAC
jgi:hypothetical protein